MNTLTSTRKYKILVCLSFMLLCKPYITLAQTNSPDSSFQKQFNAFNKSITQDFNSFRQHNDSIFLQFLTQSWKEFSVVQNKIPSPPKPVLPPTYKAPETPVVPNTDSIKSNSPIPPKAEPVNEQKESDSTEKLNQKVEPLPLPKAPDSIEQSNPKAEPSPEQKSPVIEDLQKPEEKELPKEEEQIPINAETVPGQAAMSNMVAMTKVAYYGTDFSVPSIMQGLPVLSPVSKQGIARYFAAASVSTVLNTAASTLKKEAAECRLNDWGLANLFMKAAQKMYPRQVDQVMFTWFAMLHSGYNVKVGYDERNVYLLLPSNEMLYEISYTVKGRQYYLLNFGSGQPEPEHLSIHEADYPQSIAGLSFMITQTPELTNLFTKRTLSFNRALELKLNKNLIDFYSVYPQCELKVFFKAPLSANAISQLDAYFLPALEGKKDDDRVAFLLHFIHEAIPYKTDVQQFGHEKYLFADETLYYPAADCEDRAVLLAKLVNRYTNCKAIGLSYPTHVSLAVNLTSLPNGKFITYNNQRYYHCDPTYVGASCGIPMPDFENVIPKIIDFTQ